MERELKYQKIESYMLQELSSGRFAAEDRFFSEVDIAKQFNVTVVTARKAFARLENQGYIRRRRGLGTFVQSLPGRPERLKIIKRCIVGIVTGKQNVDNSFKLGRILYELHRAIEEAGYLAMLVGEDLDPLFETEVNGVIVLDRIDFSRNCDLLRSEIPVISLYPENLPIPGITYDYRQGARKITGFLKECGARSMVLAGEGDDAQTVRHLFERPLAEAAQEAKIGFRTVVPPLDTLREELGEILDSADRPDVIFAANSWCLGVIGELLRARGLTAGKDISILVHGANALLIPSSPAFSVIDIDIAGAVRNGVGLLQQLIRDPGSEAPSVACGYGDVIDRGSIVHKN